MSRTVPLMMMVLKTALSAKSRTELISGALYQVASAEVKVELYTLTNTNAARHQLTTNTPR